MGNYLKATLKASQKSAIEADIKSITWEGEKVYPLWPDGYEKSSVSNNRFVVSEIQQEILQPAVFNDKGNEVYPAALGDWFCYLVLPGDCDISHLQTLIVE